MRTSVILGLFGVGAWLAGSCSLPKYDYAPVETSSCTDNELNGSESDIDCGGQCAPCANGSVCRNPSDCVVQSCVQARCQAEHCNDQAPGNGESDVDCGGEECQKCGVNQICAVATDCKSNACMDARCVATDCDDENLNNKETDTDCGGGTCPACGVGKRCELSGDCKTGACLAGQCSPAECGNSEKDPSEQGVDCGGICPIPCNEAACSDEDKNNAETDTDCGGGVCPRCVAGKACLVPLDCQSNLCIGSVCAEIDECPDGSTSPLCEASGGAGGVGSGGAPPETGGSAGEGAGGISGSGGKNTGGSAPRGGTSGGGAGGASGGGPPTGGGGGTLGGSGGTSGAGMGGVATGGAATGGAATGGVSTGGAGPLMRCAEGCARLTVPLTSANDKANYAIFLGNGYGFGNAKITYRVYVEAGSGGTIKGYIQHEANGDFSQLFQAPPEPLRAGLGWYEFTWDVGEQSASGFNKDNIRRVGVQVTGNGGTAWTNPTVVAVDAITVTGVPVGPWLFTSQGSISTANVTQLGTPNVMFRNAGDSPVANSSISWLGP